MRIRQETILYGHTDDIRNLVFSPDGKLLVSSSKDGSVRVWDVGEHKPMHTMSGLESLGDFLPAHFPEPSADVSWSPDGSRLAVAAPHGGHLCDATGKPMMTIEAKARRTRKVLFSPDGHRLLASFDNGYLFVWTRDGDEITRLATEKHDITDFAMSPDGDLLAAGDSAGDLSVWDATLWQLLARVHATPEWRTKAANREDCWVHDIQFVADGLRLVVRAQYGRSGFGTGFGSGAWDIVTAHLGADDDTSRLNWVGSPLGENRAPHMVASPDGQLLVIEVGSWQDEVALCDPYALSQIATLPSAKKRSSHVELLHFSSDGRFLAGTNSIGRVLIWDTALPYLAYNLPAHTELWETAELGVDMAGQDDMGEPPIYPCTALAWSPDGNYLATAGIDQIERKPYRWYVANERRTIKLWAIDYNAY